MQITTPSPFRRQLQVIHGVPLRSNDALQDRNDNAREQDGTLNIRTLVTPHQTQIQLLQYSRVAKRLKASTCDVVAVSQLLHVMSSVNAHQHRTDELIRQ